MLLFLSPLLTSCAKRDHLAADPTPTPGEMDVTYGNPGGGDLMPPEGALPAPPAENTPTPVPQPTLALAPPPEEPAAAPTPVPPTPTPVPQKVRKSYIVQRGDSLWDISGRPPILGDRWRWPLLFKANRRIIADPDLIEPGQRLTWNENYSMPEIETAIQKARDTPKFVPHFGVRKQLPIVY